MSWLLNLVTGLPSFLNGILAYLNKKQDTVAAQSANAANATTALVQADVAHTAAIKDVTTAMMSHPIFWVAWGLGVFPVLTYHAAIFFVSTLPVLGWTVLKVPAEEIAFGQTIIGSVFMLTGASSMVAGLAHAWIKRA